MHFATALEHDVVIEIRPRAKVAKKGRILIVGATRMINHAETRCALK